VEVVKPANALCNINRFPLLHRQCCMRCYRKPSRFWANILLCWVVSLFYSFYPFARKCNPIQMFFRSYTRPAEPDTESGHHNADYSCGVTRSAAAIQVLLRLCYKRYLPGSGNSMR
jgi:hypothetical protein